MTMQLDLAGAVHASDDARLRIAIATAGSATALADLLEVHRSQPGRWLKRESTPTPSARRIVDDLALVATKYVSTWPAETIRDWLAGDNAYLGGATPKDMLRSGRVSEVLAALEGELAGVYA
ncbi:hypothetical protein [Agrococcus citreus]|uniref:Antitoxin Xre/MbcA/ParS-like toxin-binding domain-containing protein n=1 Tax=Agrococcus citreus TaxID=84643 RepID=A0ABN1YW20_9MICO